MSAIPDYVLLGDIGATNARLGLVADSVLGPIASFEVARFAQFTDLIARFIAQHCGASSPRRALLAIAAPVDSNRCALTNSPWVIDTAELDAQFGIQSRLVNDFEAVAHALPLLGAPDLAKVGGATGRKSSPMTVLGPGSGLGVACLVPRAERSFVIPSEGGHATLPATCDREDQILKFLRERFGHSSAERAVSGSGLENIYRAIGALDGVETPLQNATQITTSALRGECDLAVEALNSFCAFLGSFAGNVALTFGARGGVYIAGGISPRIVDFIRRSQFRSRFEAKGRFSDYLRPIPVYVITHPHAAFIGLQSLLSHECSPPLQME